MTAKLKIQSPLMTGSLFTKKPRKNAAQKPKAKVHQLISQHQSTLDKALSNTAQWVDESIHTAQFLVDSKDQPRDQVNFQTKTSHVLSTYHQLSSMRVPQEIHALYKQALDTYLHTKLDHQHFQTVKIANRIYATLAHAKSALELFKEEVIRLESLGLTTKSIDRHMQKAEWMDKLIASPLLELREIHQSAPSQSLFLSNNSNYLDHTTLSSGADASVEMKL